MIGEVSQLANDFWILLAMVIYFAAMLSIGFIYSKRSNSSSKEYFAGGRGVGPWLTALSAEASDMSAPPLSSTRLHDVPPSPSAPEYEGRDYLIRW